MSDSSHSQPPQQATGFSLARLLLTVDHAIARFEGWVLAYGVLLMALNTVANVVARRLGQSFYFTEELNQFLMVLITFVGIGYAARRARHDLKRIDIAALPVRLGSSGEFGEGPRLDRVADALHELLIIVDIHP